MSLANRFRHLARRATGWPECTLVYGEAAQDCLLVRIYHSSPNVALLMGPPGTALEDYNSAIKVEPHKAGLYYNRGVFYAAQSDVAAALRDYDAALGIDPKLVPALRERAKIHKTQSNLSEAVADYSEAIRLQPNTAALSSERGFVYLLQHAYQSAVKDEAEAIVAGSASASARASRESCAALP